MENNTVRAAAAAPMNPSALSAGTASANYVDFPAVNGKQTPPPHPPPPPPPLPPPSQLLQSSRSVEEGEQALKEQVLRFLRNNGETWLAGFYDSYYEETGEDFNSQRKRLHGAPKPLKKFLAWLCGDDVILSGSNGYDKVRARHPHAAPVARPPQAEAKSDAAAPASAATPAQPAPKGVVVADPERSVREGRLAEPGTVLAVDLEGVELGDEKGFATLVQVYNVSAPGSAVQLFDLRRDREAQLAALRRPLESSAVLKIFHDCRADVAALAKLSPDIHVRGVFDTQVAAALLPGRPDRMSLTSALHEFLGVAHPFKDHVHALLQQRPRLWAEAELKDLLVDYAVTDVLYLGALRDRLLEQLDRQGVPRERVLQLTERRMNESRVAAGAPPLPPDPAAHAAAGATAPSVRIPPQTKQRRVPKEDPQAAAADEDDAGDEDDDGSASALSDEEMEAFLNILPACAREALEAKEDALDLLVDVHLDVGRVPVARFARPEPRSAVAENESSTERAVLGEQELTQADIDEVCARLPRFDRNQRTGIEGTLHRVSRIVGRDGEHAVGLTARVGRSFIDHSDAALLIPDVLQQRKSILFLGSPGVGKTTALRCAARMMAEKGFVVVVVDTSNEIAGEGSLPHPALGDARRISVPYEGRQAQILLQAVQNHSPEVVVIDEIRDADESRSAASITARGVQLLGSAHGLQLADLTRNPDLRLLVGDVESALLGDQAARFNPTGKSTRLRMREPVFPVCIELRSRREWFVFHNVADAVDRMLRREKVQAERRTLREEDGEYVIEEEPVELAFGEDYE